MAHMENDRIYGERRYLWITVTMTRMEAVGYDSYYSTLAATVVPTAPIVPTRTGLSLCCFQHAVGVR
jgi:hypothetical protein